MRGYKSVCCYLYRARHYSLQTLEVCVAASPEVVFKPPGLSGAGVSQASGKGGSQETSRLVRSFTLLLGLWQVGCQAPDPRGVVLWEGGSSVDLPA